MEKLLSLLNLLRINEDLTNLIKGEIHIPYLDDFNEVDAYWYPHPPALIPIFLGHGASYKGICKHFFVKRDSTFVDFFLEWDYMLEVARDEKQLLTLMVLQMIMLKEEVNDEIADFCKAIHFQETEKVLEFAENFGDDPYEFRKLIHFENNTPLTYLKNIFEYKGDYPSSELLINEKVLTRSCSFEIASSQVNNIPNAPNWFDKIQNKTELFNSYFDKKQYDKAWLTLNSHGWRPSEVVTSLQKLERVANDDIFNIVVENWISNWINIGKRKDDGY